MPQATAPDTLRRIRWVQGITITCMCAEAAISLFAAWRAKSPALLAFGGDSVIELASAVVVLWMFRTNAASEQLERQTAKIAGGLLFALAASVVAASVMALRLAAAVFMPVLAKEKRRLSAQTGSASLRADATESALCGYMSFIALLGVVVNAIWHVKWADPMAALVVLPLIVWEGQEAMRGKTCDCC
jgi:divalent metal cation (Fe/Co/Zn/Cd) transporter